MPKHVIHGPDGTAEVVETRATEFAAYAQMERTRNLEQSVRDLKARIDVAEKRIAALEKRK